MREIAGAGHLGPILEPVGRGPTSSAGSSPPHDSRRDRPGCQREMEFAWLHSRDLQGCDFVVDDAGNRELHDVAPLLDLQPGFRP